MKEFYILFTKELEEYGKEALIIAEKKLTFEKQEELLNNGYEITWDSARSEKEAIKYAEEFCNAYIRKCCICGGYFPTSLIKGRRFSFQHNKYIVFNGYVCEQCEDSYEVTRNKK